MSPSKQRTPWNLVCLPVADALSRSQWREFLDIASFLAKTAPQAKIPSLWFPVVLSCRTQKSWLPNREIGCNLWGNLSWWECKIQRIKRAVGKVKFVALPSAQLVARKQRAARIPRQPLIFRREQIYLLRSSLILITTRLRPRTLVLRMSPVLGMIIHAFNHRAHRCQCFIVATGTWSLTICDWMTVTASEAFTPAGAWPDHSQPDTQVENKAFLQHTRKRHRNKSKRTTIRECR